MKTWVLVLLAVSACMAHAQNVVKGVPKSVVIRFHAFEIPTGLRYSVSAKDSQKDNTRSVHALSNDDLLKKLAAMDKNDCVRQITAPMVRTIDALPASISQTIVGPCGDKAVLLSFKATPRVMGEDRVQLRVDAKVFSGEEGKEGHCVFWSSKGARSISGSEPCLIPVSFKDPSGERHRMLIFVRTEVIQDGA